MPNYGKNKVKDLLVTYDGKSFFDRIDRSWNLFGDIRYFEKNWSVRPNPKLDQFSS